MIIFLVNNEASAPSTPSKPVEDDQGDYDDGIDFDSTTLTDMPHQNLPQRGPSDQKHEERVGSLQNPHQLNQLSQHPQSSGLQDELARKLKERNQVVPIRISLNL